MAAVDEEIPVLIQSEKCQDSPYRYGSADKSQMQNMVKKLLLLKEIPKPDDAADALAIAMCHINTSRFNTLIGAQS